MFWDRQNRPIEDTLDWARKFEDAAYRIVAIDTDGPHLPMVSTVWQGLAQEAPLHPTDDTVLIFETAYLEDGHVKELWHDHSEEDALARHRIVCLSMLGREPRPEDGLVRRVVESEKGRNT
jgi:hypothetical protein